MMVYVPAGPFTMGIDEADSLIIAGDLGFTNAARLWAWEAFPKHTVDVPGFFIDQCEVTVKRWQQFVEETGHQSKSKETSRHFGKPDERLLPAGEMTWAEAKAYAAWAGKALPTEAQWEKAARGTDGRYYPWGNEPPTLDRGHFSDPKARQHPPLYVKVGQYPTGASPCGALDMLGNQYEWTSERSAPYAGNPMGARMLEYAGPTNDMVCLRGGSWYHGWVGYYAAKRFGFKSNETYYHVGFRTVWVPPETYFGSKDFRRARQAAEDRRSKKEPVY